MKCHPDADDITVICDGDVTPYHPVPDLGDSASFGTYRTRYPKTNFHFQAFGRGSEVNHMFTMAQIGDGQFSYTTP